MKNIMLLNFPMFIECLLMLLLGLGIFVVYKRSKRKKRKFHAPPTHQLPFAKKVRYYEREMKLIFDKWNLEKIKKIKN